ncbi:hypothetical protein RM844_16910 [Streptomyces sp. DSM 44915]|uniref:Uncharacterized protein n=1 Tax=Streptomyces chisholmiae TaxID=3075540 RepID=A0ABU2JSJ2_9ACTN|nr:hypothetical protein [Streptomyces sp. DSM 44915]MDT0267962.1 hypothetical protein [Streptomyces sp. DSM 44915]
MEYHLQVCDTERSLGHRVVSLHRDKITAEDLAEIAQDMDRAYEIQLDEGVVYELRMWDGDEAFWTGHFLYLKGELHAAETLGTEFPVGPTPEEAPDEEGQPDTSVLVNLEIIDNDQQVKVIERNTVHVGSVFSVPMAEIAERWHDTSVIKLAEGTRYQLVVKVNGEVLYGMYYTRRNGKLQAG